MKKLLPYAVALSAVAASCASSTTSRADDVVIVKRPTVVEEREPVRTSTDTTLIGSGVVVLGISYGAAVIVASTSTHHGDSHLYVPIVGPWLDLADRGSCPVSYTTCDPETTNKVLIVADGIFQAIGALSIVGGLFSERREREYVRTAQPAPKLYVAPARIGRSGYGLTATGTF